MLRLFRVQWLRVLGFTRGFRGFFGSGVELSFGPTASRTSKPRVPDLKP